MTLVATSWLSGKMVLTLASVLQMQDLVPWRGSVRHANVQLWGCCGWCFYGHHTCSTSSGPDETVHKLGSTFFVRQFLCVQEHLMNTPRQILMYEALGLKVHPSQFFIPFTSCQWYMGGKCSEGQRMNKVDRWMIDVRTYRECLYGSIFLRAKQVNTKSSRFQLSRTCPWFWLRTAWDCCICRICHVSKGLILSCPARLEFWQARIEQSFQSDMELSLWESWSLVHHVASFINCIVTHNWQKLQPRWCSCICRDIVDHNNLDFCHRFFWLWQGIRIEATWHLEWYWPQSLVWLDLRFQLCICEMTRSTTWHNWDGMMELSRQVF